MSLSKRLGWDYGRILEGGKFSNHTRQDSILLGDA
jgi:hypothetical protein